MLLKNTGVNVEFLIASRSEVILVHKLFKISSNSINKLCFAFFTYTGNEY